MALFEIALGGSSRQRKDYTHDDLTTRAAEWLHNKCVIVAKEMKAVDQVESPDCIGFRKNYETILVECKSNHLDYIQDLKKPHRQFESHGMGYRRYYFCPPGVISQHELPPKWGLIYVNPTRCEVVRESGFFEHDRVREFNFLLKIIRRIGQYAPKDLLIAQYQGDADDVFKA